MAHSIATEMNMARHFDRFPVGSIVAINDLMWKDSHRHYTKAQVVRHTKTRIVVAEILPDGELSKKTASYRAEDLWCVGTTLDTLRRSSKLMIWNDDLYLGHELSLARKNLANYRSSMANLHNADFASMKRLAVSIADTIHFIESNSDRYSKALEQA